MPEKVKIKNPYSGDLINHFAPLHEIFVTIANSTDELETEGGLTWSFEYLHGRGHTAKLGDQYLFERADFHNPNDIYVHTHSIAELIWLATGNPNHYHFEMDHGHKPKDEYEAERNKAISAYYGKAREIISLYRSAPCDKCFISFARSDGLWINFSSVVLQGRNAVVHSALWSVD